MGQITIADRDYVDWSNLQRQQLYAEEDARNAVPKAIAAKKRLSAIHSGATIQAVVGDMGVEEMHEIIPEVDLIIDATDNFDSWDYKSSCTNGGSPSSHGGDESIS